METLRYLDKQNNLNERNNFAFWWKEQINIYGQMTEYYATNATLSAMNPIYGEQPNLSFGTGQNLVVMLNLNNDFLLLRSVPIV